MAKHTLENGAELEVIASDVGIVFKITRGDSPTRLAVVGTEDEETVLAVSADGENQSVYDFAVSFCALEDGGLEGSMVAHPEGDSRFFSPQYNQSLPIDSEDVFNA